MILYFGSILASLYVYFGFHLCKIVKLLDEFFALEENFIEELEMEFHPDVAAAA